MKLSVIIPAFNEEERLPLFLKDMIRFYQGASSLHEVIIVDDGSSDKTSAVAKKFTSQLPNLSVVRNHQNKGKGYSVKRGMLVAEGDILIFLDADGSTQPEEITKNLFYLEKEGYDILIGSRELHDRRQKLVVKEYRKWMGLTFNFFVNLFLLKGLHGSQCGFKMFKRSVAKELFSRQQIDGFGFDLEILYLAQRFGYKIKESPISWEHRDGSKIDLVKDSLKMFFNIFEVRYFHRNAKLNTQEITFLSSSQQKKTSTQLSSQLDQINV